MLRKRGAVGGGSEIQTSRAIYFSDILQDTEFQTEIQLYPEVTSHGL